MSPRYPEPGRCGACTRPARRYPSGRWEHDGVPCRARNGWGDPALGMPLPPCEFVPDGDELPSYGERRWPMTVESVDDTGFPTSLGLVNPRDVDTYWAAVREQLRVEAEGRAT